MKFISLNIEANKHYDTIYPFFEKEQSDVICLQELLEEDFLVVKEKTGLQGVFKVHGRAASGLQRHADIYGKRYGVGIFSKNIVDSGHFFYWGKEENTEVSIEEYVADREKFRSYVCVWADVKNNEGEIFRYAVTHFPVTTKGESSPHQLEILPSFFEGLDTLGNFVLCGDFNAPRGNETFTKIATKYKDNIPTHYKTSIDQNLHRDKDQKIMFVVDGLFTTEKYTTENVRLVDGVSDHMAVVATILKI